MEKESEEVADTQGEIKRPEKKKEKEETLFDRRINWLKNHPFYSWVLIIAFGGGTLVTIVTMWGNAAPRIKNFVNDVTPGKTLATNPEARRTLEIIKNYFDDLADGKFKAANYFASRVDKYFLVSDLTPAEIDSYYTTNGMEFLSPKTVILDSTFSFSKDPAGNQTVNFWAEFTCFRKSKSKHEYCLTRIEFVFDKNNRITKLVEIEHKNLKFTNKEMLFEGTVGKLPAIFNLTFDYMNRKITGTYYYPTRKKVTYDIAGTIIGNRIELTEYTNGGKTATCTLESKDQKSFDGTMFNMDGRQLKMTIRTAEFLFLEG